MSNKIKLFGVNWATDEGGPSPDNNMRTELYFMGCERAVQGNPCEGCHNPDLWENRINAKARDPRDIAAHVAAHAPNKFITIVGGEPTDQMEGLVDLCKLLKADGFHIIVFTWRSLNIPSSGQIHPMWMDLIKHIDILVDGEYKADQRIFVADAGDGFFNTIGSANQGIWDLKEWNDNGCQGTINGQYAGDLVGLYVLPSGDLRYITKENVGPIMVTLTQRGAA